MDNKIDEDLLGNEKIEEAILGLQKETSQETAGGQYLPALTRK